MRLEPLDNNVTQEDYVTFMRLLKESQPWLYVIVRWLNRLGIKARVLATEIFPTSVAERGLHSDNGDIEYVLRDGRSFVCEVKHINAEFTSSSDWPFNGFIVDAVYAYDKKDPKPYLYFVINKSGTHVAILSTSSNQGWDIRVIADKRYNMKKNYFYIAPVSRVTFVRIEDL